MQELLVLLLAVLLLPVALLALYELSPEKRRLRPGGAPGIAGGADYTVTGHYPRLHVLHAGRDGRLYGVEDHYLYVSEDGGRSFHRRGALPKTGGGFKGQLKNALARTRLMRRLRANRGPSNIEVLSTGTILIFFDQIYRSSDGGRSFQPVCTPAELGLKAGPFVFGVGTAVGPDDSVYFGEYTTEKRPHPAAIVRGREDGTRWEIAHRFESGAIFHVHSIHYDRYRRGYWVCTGDYNEETALLFTGDDFKTLTPVGQGSQDWRIVSLIVTPDYLYWGSDNDRPEGAAIFRFDPGRQRLEKLQHIGKVSYYAAQLADGTLAVSTTYEPNSVFTKAASPRASSEVWISRDGEHWQCLLDVPYEPMQESWGPARAQIAFPAGEPLERLFVIPRYTQGDPFKTLVLELPPADRAARPRGRAVA